MSNRQVIICQHLWRYQQRVEQRGWRQEDEARAYYELYWALYKAFGEDFREEEWNELIAMQTAPAREGIGKILTEI